MDDSDFRIFAIIANMPFDEWKTKYYELKVECDQLKAKVFHGGKVRFITHENEFLWRKDYIHIEYKMDEASVIRIALQWWGSPKTLLELILSSNKFEEFVINHLDGIPEGTPLTIPINILNMISDGINVH